jgi:hypothetical protein
VRTVNFELKLSSQHLIALLVTNEPAIDVARSFLQSLQRFDLAALLEPCTISYSTPPDRYIDDDWSDMDVESMAQANAPTPIDSALNALREHDRKRIAEAISNGFKLTHGLERLSVVKLPFEAKGAVLLLAELIIHRQMMIAVATGEQRIQDVNDYYVARQVRLQEAIPADIPYNNPHNDLWAWFRHWKEHFGSYAERRTYVRGVFAPAIEALARRTSLFVVEREPSGWERVDRALGKARARLELASAEEDYQAVGLLCREVIISLAQAVFDPTIHKIIDGVEASKTDANRMLEAYGNPRASSGFVSVGSKTSTSTYCDATACSFVR